MRLNHPDTIPHPTPPPSLETLSSTKPVPGAKKVGDHCFRQHSEKKIPQEKQRKGGCKGLGKDEGVTAPALERATKWIQISTPSHANYVTSSKLTFLCLSSLICIYLRIVAMIK